MSRYENLFIYRKSMELTVFIEQIVAHFSQYHKYTIGSKLRDLTYSTTVMIIKINNRPKGERKELLLDLREKIEEIKVCLSFLKNLQKNIKEGFQLQIFGILSSFTSLFLIKSKFSTFRVENLKSFPQFSTTKVENWEYLNSLKDLAGLITVY